MMTERLCAINTLIATVVQSINRIDEMNWMLYVLNGWTIAAGDFSVFVASPIILIVETDKADFNEIYRVLNEEVRLTLKAA